MKRIHSSAIVRGLVVMIMVFSKSIKVPLDYSIFCVLAGAFALSVFVKPNA
jgi:hypothetical protein